MKIGNFFSRSLFTLLFVCTFIVVEAQTDTIQSKPDQKYIPETFCMNLMDGVTVLMADGQQVTTDVTLKNGTRVTPSGKVIRADGTEVILKDKDCIDSSGQLIRAEGAKPAKNKSRKK